MQQSDTSIEYKLIFCVFGKLTR